MVKKQRRMFLVVLSIVFILLVICSVVAAVQPSGVGEKATSIVPASTPSVDGGSSSSGGSGFGVTAKVIDDATTDGHGLGGELISPGVTEPGIEERPKPVPLSNLVISPSRQVTNDGSAEYKIIFKDSHTPYLCGTKVYCGSIGTKSEGWYDSKGLIRYDNCANCVAQCDALGTKSEGWYNSCDGSLIKYGECSSACPAIEVIPLELGDVNNDGVVNEDDLNYLLDYLYKGGPAPVPLMPDNSKAKRGDINQDGVVDVGDVVALTNFLQGRGSTTVVYQRYSYKLSFATLTSQGVQGSFEQFEFNLGAGQTFTTTLTVKADKEGSNYFVVSVKEVNGDYFTSASGVLIYTLSHPEDPSFFAGQGFILNDGETQGSLIELAISRKGDDLSGKMAIAGVVTFDIEGKVFESTIIHEDLDNLGGLISDSTEYSGHGLGGALYSQTLVKFDVSHPSAGVIASFSGYLKQLDTFKLLKGTLTDKVGNKWSLTAYGKKQFYVVTPTEQAESVEVAVDEVMVFSEVASAGAGATTIAESASGAGIESGTEVYIRPVEVYRKKILGIFPIGKRVVDVELIKPGEVIEETISEDSTGNVGGYTVSVGSLADEDKIEISIQA